MNESFKIIFPEKIEVGSTIGVTALSSGLGDTRGLIKAKHARDNLINQGFKVIETSNVRLDNKLVSSNVKQRADEFISLIENDDVSYIMIACGGEFLMETLPYINENKEKILSSKSKWIQGFSDVSLLNFYLTTNLKISTIHANSFSSYSMIPLDKSLRLPLMFVQNPVSFQQESFSFFEKERDRSQGSECNPYVLTEQVKYKNLYHDNSNEKISFSGRIIGGCMDVLKTILGTPYDNTKAFCDLCEEGNLWYLENCEMSVTDIKRTLWQMKEAKWFENSKGFIIGRTNSSESIGDFTYEDALHDIFDELKVPVIYDVDIGHVAPQWTIINGALGVFEYTDDKSILKQYITR